MNLPKNKNGKFYLLNGEGKEVEFNHAIDAQEALFGIFGKDDRDENFQSQYRLPDDFDMKINLKKNTGNTKEELMQRQLKKGRGRPPKIAESDIKSEDLKKEGEKE